MRTDIANKKVLITGANGFIGSHMTKRLVNEGADVFILVRESSDLWRIEEFIKEVKVFKVDLRDRDKIFNAVNEIRPDYVFHMGAYGVDSRQKDYFTAVNTNVVGTMNLLAPLTTLGCEKFLNIGTCMEYGDKKLPIKEDSHLEPFNIYGSTKASATLLAHQIAGENDIRIVTLRAFGIFGENEGSHKFFPHIILSILNKSEVTLTGCEQFRDYTYIENIIDGFILAALNEKVKNDIFNIGSGAINQLKYYVNLIYSKMEASKEPNYGAIPYRDGEVWTPLPDITMIKEKLGWEPRISLEEGLDKTIHWFKNNQKKYK